VIEGARPWASGHGTNVPFGETNGVRNSVRRRVPDGKNREVRLDFDSVNMAAGHPINETQGSRANPRSDVKHTLTRFGGNGCGQQDRIDSHAIAFGRLPQNQLATK
jgi:hypothetical protein